MVLLSTDDTWIKRGFSLLWGLESLAQVAMPTQVISMRQFFEMAESWPDELPASDGNAVVVSGLEGCLDILSPEDVSLWLENELREIILSFQSEYEGQAALILWVPSGRSRISMVGATEQYYWKHVGSKSERGLHIGQLLWSGAEQEVERLLETDKGHTDYDGKAWVGLHHPRIS